MLAAKYILSRISRTPLDTISRLALLEVMSIVVFCSEGFRGKPLLLSCSSKYVRSVAFKSIAFLVTQHRIAPTVWSGQSFRCHIYCVSSGEESLSGTRLLGRKRPLCEVRPMSWPVSLGRLQGALCEFLGVLLGVALDRDGVAVP